MPPILSCPTPEPATRKLSGGVGLTCTLNLNVTDVVANPSLTLIVISAIPAVPERGVTVTVRWVPVPARAIFESGTRSGFVDTAATVRFVTEVSVSLIVK